jgi:hypothetical protein
MFPNVERADPFLFFFIEALYCGSSSRPFSDFDCIFPIVILLKVGPDRVYVCYYIDIPRA